MHYFAYGSNMDINHMRRLCGWHCHILSHGVLKRHELILDTKGYPNISPKHDMDVYGILYEVDEKAVEALDGFEGYPEVYDRKMVEVLDGLGHKTKAWIYFKHEGYNSENKFHPGFWEKVIAAAYDQRLPKKWIAYLESFLNK